MTEKTEMEILERLTKVEQKVNNQCEKCKYITGDFDYKIKETKGILEEMRNLSVAIAKLTEQIDHNSQEVVDLKKKMDKQIERPANKWNDLTKSIITATASGLIALVISLVFK